MAYNLSLDYTLAKRFLKALDNLIASEGDSIKRQIINLQQIEVPSNCQGNYANATVEKLTQLNSEWQDIMLHLKDCEVKIANKVEQIHSYDMQQQAKQSKPTTSTYYPISTFNVDDMFYGKSYSELNKMTGKKIDTSKYGSSYSVKTTNGKSRSFNRPQCTWYAAARYEEVNGKGSLVMTSGSANGKEWYKRVDSNTFNVTQIKSNGTTNYSAIKSNSLACANNNGWGGSSQYGHVVYIEGVATDSKGKTYVFFSDGGPGYAKSGKLGEVKKWDIDKFAKTYDYVMTAK